jgi:tetratricopeptide (TPR) repeat protein
MLAVLFACQSHALRADQNAPELAGLFDDLVNAEGASDAMQIESKIWQHWLKAPNDISEALMSQIVYAMQGGQLTLAIKLCDQLIDSEPEFSEAWNKRATLHYLVGDLDSSVDDIRQTVKLEPRHFGAISGLGLIFLKRGQLQNALDAFEQVLKINPNSVNTQRSIEQVTDQLGDKI